MEDFTVYGSINFDGEWRPFEREVEAPSAETAEEWALSLFGSEHSIERRFIEVEKVTTDTNNGV